LYRSSIAMTLFLLSVIIPGIFLLRHLYDRDH